MNFEKIYRVRRAGWSQLQWSVYTNEWNAINFLPETDANTLLNMIKSIQDKMPTGKKLNIMIDKTSDVPRPKMKEYIEDNGHKKVTLLSKADVVVVRRETAKLLLNSKFESVRFISDKDKSRIDKLNTNKLYLDVKGHNENNMDQEYFDVKNNCTEEVGMMFTAYRTKIVNEGIAFLMSLVGSGKTLVYDDAFLNTLNKDGLDLDDEVFETLSGMLLSKDNETFKLGIEMLGNVNLENNLFRISLLMNKTFTQTSRFSALSQYQSKNFKSLLGYLDAQGIRWNQGWERYGLSMYNKFRNTEYEKNIKQYIVDCINKQFSKLMGNDATEVVNIIFK